MATTGISTRVEILKGLGAPTAGGWGQKVFTTLRREKLVDCAVIGRGRFRVTLVRLSPWGEQVCRSLGLWPVLSEWSTLIEGHAGSVQESHTAAVLLFCFYARLFGWKVELLPVCAIKECFPDVRISKGIQELYIEVERFSGGEFKLEKWLNQERLQGSVAVCMLNPDQRTPLVEKLRSFRLHGMATDLLSLKRGCATLWIDVF